MGSKDKTCDRFRRWTELCEDLCKEEGPHNKWTKYCNVDAQIHSECRCLGITISNTPSSDGIASLRDLRMWKKTNQ